VAEAELTPQDIIDQIPAAFQADKAQGLDATYRSTSRAVEAVSGTW